MKSKSFIALAIAGAFSCASAFAGGTKHGSVHHGSSMSGMQTVEVSTPSSVNESAPWLAGKPHLAGWTAPHDSTTLSMSDQLSSTSDGSDPYYVVNVTEYWLIGEAPADSSAIGGTSSMGAGFGGFDSSSGSFDQMSRTSASDVNEIVIYTPAAEEIYQSMGDETVLISEHYLVPAPESSYDPSSFLVLAIAPTAEDIALLDSLKEDFYIVTPTYGEG